MVKTIGTRAKVWHGTAEKTAGGLKKADLMKNKRGEIVSKKKQALGLKALKHLHNAGYIAVKGKFGTKKQATVTKTARPAAKKVKKATKSKTLSKKLFEKADTNKDSVIDYKEWVKALK
jgi:hypothetical protein